MLSSPSVSHAHSSNLHQMSGLSATTKTLIIKNTIAAVDGSISCLPQTRRRSAFHVAVWTINRGFGRANASHCRRCLCVSTIGARARLASSDWFRAVTGAFRGDLVGVQSTTV